MNTLPPMNNDPFPQEYSPHPPETADRNGSPIPSRSLNNLPPLPGTVSSGSGGPSASRPGAGAKSKKLRIWWIVGGIVLLGAAAGTTAMLAGGSKTNRPDLLLHTVTLQSLDLTVVERGTLESVENKDVTCLVKASKGGNFATTIKYVIDDGTYVRAGEHICDLDSAALDDQKSTQKIAVSNARANLIKAIADRKSAINENLELLIKAEDAVRNAELDVANYVGLPKDLLPQLTDARQRKSFILELESDFDKFLVHHQKELAGHSGEFQQLLEDVNGRIQTAEAEYDQWKDKAAYSQRMVIKGYVSQSQAQADEARLNSAFEGLKKVRTEKQRLQTYISQKSVKSLCSLLRAADIGLEKTKDQTDGRQKFVDEDLIAKRTTEELEVKKLKEIEEQILACRIYAPQDGLVVYYIPEQSRFGGGSQQSIIAQGEPVREGQKLMRIPNLQKMQVVARVHEAMIARIRPDEYASTGAYEAIRKWMPYSRLMVPELYHVNNQALDELTTAFHKEDHTKVGDGMPARIKVDAFSEIPMTGHVNSVAAVASQDFFTSDVKVYQTVVGIDLPDAFKDPSKMVTSQKKPSRPGKKRETTLRPGMSAEVTIQIEHPLEQVLAVPVQAVIGGPELGDKRKVYVMTDNGPAEREIRIGLANDKFAEVREGLKDGDKVVENPKVLLGDKAKTTQVGSDANEKGKGKGKFGPKQ